MLATDSWLLANQRYLSVAIAQIQHTLAERFGLTEWIQDSTQLHQSLHDAQAALPAPSALDQLTRLFELSSFERDLLLMCAGMELDSRFSQLFVAIHGDPQRAYPTFSLALTSFSNSHWSALTPAAPLRYHRLIEVGQGNTITLSPLRIDERILHHLVGSQYLDARLFGLVNRAWKSDELVPSQAQFADAIATVLSEALMSPDPPVIQLCGSETTAKHYLATVVCDRLNLNLWIMSAQTVPSSPTDLDQFCRLWKRETRLNANVLLFDCNELESPEPAYLNRLTHFIERTPTLLFISSRDRLRLPQRTVVNFEVEKPTIAEQRIIWQRSLSNQMSSEQLQTLVSQFNLNTATIRNVCSSLKKSDFSTLWEACRVQARPRLDELAQRIEPRADWDDLVLPEAQTLILKEAAAHVRQRSTVYETWGFGAKGSRGLGISALFAGASGTGKTLAAEVLAHELQLDLYRVDLSSVVSKYIGETEKNLRRVFDAAEDGGVILLFDEADALFGKRSEVKDSRDRYANIEVSYLLQRMECYPGLAVLTTNLKSSLDSAFLRRIRFVVQFPFPDSTQRAEIWRRIFPSTTPTQELDALKLAKLNIAGGNIRNIALNAAFLAADMREPVQMKHLLQAAKTEYAKLEKNLTESEVAEWI
ncbi:ATP-binding protein [Cyanobacteria bacterium FACHB-63]|nr:ATP-binding protein [Cyanobacteria bacterium FACHB-63]